MFLEFCPGQAVRIPSACPLSARLPMKADVSSLALMAADAKLVSIRIAKIGAIIVGVIFRPKTGLTLVSSSVPYRQRMTLIDQRTTAREEGDHLAVSRRRRPAVERTGNYEQRPVGCRMLPARPFLAREFRDQTESFKKRHVERPRATDIGHPEGRV